MTSLQRLERTCALARESCGGGSRRSGGEGLVVVDGSGGGCGADQEGGGRVHIEWRRRAGIELRRNGLRACNGVEQIACGDAKLVGPGRVEPAWCMVTGIGMGYTVWRRAWACWPHLVASARLRASMTGVIAS